MDAILYTCLTQETVVKVVAASIVAALTALNAGAEVKQNQIADYNAAILSGDVTTQLAAARELAGAAISDPANSEAPLLAYEAAWTLCRLGECASAIAPAAFAASRDLTVGTPRILSTYAEWNTRPGRSTLARLRAALAAEADFLPTMISLRAFREVYLADNAEKRFADSVATAELAAAHFSKAEGGGLPEFESEARLVAAVSGFVYRPKLPAMKKMAALAAGLYGQYYRAGEDGPAWMKDHYWQSEAWLYAMQAYFKSRSQPSLNEADWKALQQAEIAAVPARSSHASVDTRPLCSGELIQKPALTYPASAKLKGMSGAVIVGFDVEDGALSDFEVLASVPLDGFREKSLETVSQWSWRFTEAPGPHCKTSLDDVVVPLTFWLG